MFQDKDYTVRIYSQQCDDKEATSWKLLAKDVKEFRELYDKLVNDPCLEKFKSIKWQFLGIFLI